MHAAVADAAAALTPIRADGYAVSDDLPVIGIELVRVFGGALLFGWWQLRSIERDRRKAAEDGSAHERAASNEKAG